MLIALGSILFVGGIIFGLYKLFTCCESGDSDFSSGSYYDYGCEDEGFSGFDPMKNNDFFSFNEKPHDSSNSFDRDLDNGEYDDDPDILMEEDPDAYNECYGD